jgi:hypothetical protein
MLMGMSVLLSQGFDDGHGPADLLGGQQRRRRDVDSGPMSMSLRRL